jgi:hypothetical protein
MPAAVFYLAATGRCKPAAVLVACRRETDASFVGSWRHFIEGEARFFTLPHIVIFVANLVATESPVSEMRAVFPLRKGKSASGIAYATAGFSLDPSTILANDFFLKLSRRQNSR